jgi:hypothetical protein
MLSQTYWLLILVSWMDFYCGFIYLLYKYNENSKIFSNYRKDLQVWKKSVGGQKLSVHPVGPADRRPVGWVDLEKLRRVFPLRACHVNCRKIRAEGSG